MAKAPKNLLVGFEFPLKGWDTGWARQKQPGLTTPDVRNCMPFDLDRRARGAKRPGFSVLTGGAIGSVAATYRQAQRCTNNLFAGLYVPTTDPSSYPYTFSYLGVCYYVQESTPTTETPSGTIPSAGSRTTYVDCAACATGISPPPSPPAAYKQVRRCTDDGLAPYWIAAAGLTYPGYVLRDADDNCYYYLSADPTTTSPGTLIGTSSTYGSCVLCDAARGGGGTDNYYQAKLCSDNTYVDCWLNENDLGPLAPPVNNLPIYFFRYDFPDEPVYILAAEATSSTPGRVYDRVTETIPASSCTQLGGCYESTMPTTGSVTFTGVSMNPSCTGTIDGLDSWKTTGTFNGTWTLTKISQTSSRVVYKGYPSTGDPRVFVYFCEIGFRNDTCHLTSIPGVCETPDVVITAGFTIRLEIDITLGTPTGWRLTVDKDNEATGPRGFRGELTPVSSCRGSKVIGNSITTREINNHESNANTDAFASGGQAVVTLAF